MLDQLLDHIVGAQQERGREVQPKRLCSLEVDNQFEFFGVLNREIGGFRSVEYFGCVKCQPDETWLKRLLRRR